MSRSKSSWKSVAVVAVAQTRWALDADAAMCTSARLCDRVPDKKGSATASGFGRGSEATRTKQGVERVADEMRGCRFGRASRNELEAALLVMVVRVLPFRNQLEGDMGCLTRVAFELEMRFALDDTRFEKISVKGEGSDTESRESQSKEGSVSAQLYTEMFPQEGERRFGAAEWLGSGDALARHV